MRTMLIFVGFFKAPLLFLVCLTKGSVDSIQLLGPEVVTAALGGYVTISCQYDHRFRENTKYWCKGHAYYRCHKVVETPKKRLSDRSSIADDKEAGVITVTMHSLSKRDEDMYWCAIERSGKDISTGVRLRISQTVLTLTTPPSSSLERDELSWWMTLRWILLILMLCCLALAHVTVRKIKAAKKRSRQHQCHHDTLNIYD